MGGGAVGLFSTAFAHKKSDVECTLESKTQDEQMNEQRFEQLSKKRRVGFSWIFVRRRNLKIK
jgi:hypothetical protein